MKHRRPGAFAALVCLAACCALAGCNEGKEMNASLISIAGNAEQGKQVIQGYGCGACHIIPGIPNARGLVGPPLNFFAQRTMIAGELPNTSENLMRWIQNPQSIEPHTAMPRTGRARQSHRAGCENRQNPVARLHHRLRCRCAYRPRLQAVLSQGPGC